MSKFDLSGETFGMGRNRDRSNNTGTSSQHLKSAQNHVSVALPFEEQYSEQDFGFDSGYEPNLGSKSNKSVGPGASPVSSTLPERQKGPNKAVSRSTNTVTGTGTKTAHRPVSGAQGANGQGKMQITSIRFTPENHYYVRQEAAMRGQSVIDFVNWVVERYRSDAKNVHASGVYKAEDKW